MSVFSSKNLLALFAMAACMAASFSTVDAAGIRGQDSRVNNLETQERNLMGKGKGKGKGKHMKPNGVFQGGVNAITQSVVAPQAPNPMSVEAFSQKCPNQANDLDSCVSSAGGNQAVCMTCVMGVANFASSTINGLLGCSRAGGGDGGFCKKCDRQVIAYHNCGTGKNFGVPAVPTVGVPAVPTVGVPQAGAAVNAPVAVPALPTDYAPETTCPFYTPTSGDICDIRGDFKYLKCYFERGVICTCRYDTPGGPVYNCVD